MNANVTNSTENIKRENRAEAKVRRFNPLTFDRINDLVAFSRVELKAIHFLVVRKLNIHHVPIKYLDQAITITSMKVTPSVFIGDADKTCEIHLITPNT